MAYGSYSFSSINRAYQLQTKVGLKVPGGIYIGPEITFSGSAVYQQRRLGLHASSFRIGPLQIGVSAGWAHDRKLGHGYYLGTNAYATF